MNSAEPDLTQAEIRALAEAAIRDHPGGAAGVLAQLGLRLPTRTEDLFALPPAVDRRHEPREEAVTYRLKVELLESTPPIWRRLEIASDMSLPRLHLVLQAAMGWWDCHLHEFIHSGDRRDRTAERFTAYNDPDAAEGGALDEAEVRVDELLGDTGDKILYWYDFGDDWMHRVTLEKILERGVDAPAAEIVDGRRACPPEDCGGIWTYCEMIAGRADREMVEFYGDLDPAAFDLEEARERVAEALTAPVNPAEERLVEARNLLILLDHLGDGVALTKAGKLPPASVRALMAETGWDRTWIGECNREDWTYPIVELREWARALGLTRKYKGMLKPTRLGESFKGEELALAEVLDRRIPFDRMYGSPRM